MIKLSNIYGERTNSMTWVFNVTDKKSLMIETEKDHSVKEINFWNEAEDVFSLVMSVKCKGLLYIECFTLQKDGETYLSEYQLEEIFRDREDIFKIYEVV